MILCFAFTLFVSAALLFLVEPMVAKMVLPLLGGAPEVWNTCMVFFQAALMAGYAYAHVLARRMGVRRQALIHVAVLLVGVVLLPIGVKGWSPPEHAVPAIWLLGLLAVCAGLPFFAVAATAPLLQGWIARTAHRSARDPYYLYGASNLGSVLALLSYPALMEPALGLKAQALAWTGGYGLLVVLIGLCALLAARSSLVRGTDVEESSATATTSSAALATAPTFWRRLRWVALALIPSSLMLGVTTYLTVDIAPIPLLWVVPLGLYLLSFVLAFSGLSPLFHPAMVLLFPVAAVLIVLSALSILSLSIYPSIALHLAAFFVAAMVCHGELARTRPPVAYLTEYYLWAALGGVLGGAFNALVAPLLFDRIAEYPFAIALVFLLQPQLGWRRLTILSGRSTDGGPNCSIRAPGKLETVGLPLLWIVFGIVLGGLFVQAAYNEDSESLLKSQRTFFGVLQVRHDSSRNLIRLAHGTTTHGAQSMEPALRFEPLTYYHRGGPIGQVFEAFRGSRAKDNFAVVGLGTGTLAAYAGRGQRITFYEIDSAVEGIARDGYFSYLADAEARGAKVQVILGDARLQLAAGTEKYGLICVDAFTSDAIPTHLLTREAIAVYMRRLAEDGILALHISNRYFRLGPVVADLAADAGLVCLYQDEDDLSSDDIADGKYESKWALLARRPEDLGPLLEDRRWSRLQGQPGRSVWTDDYSNVLRILVWIAPPMG